MCLLAHPGSPCAAVFVCYGPRSPGRACFGFRGRHPASGWQSAEYLERQNKQNVIALHGRCYPPIHCFSMGKKCTSFHYPMGGITHKMCFFLITSLHMGKAKQKKFYARICSKLFKIYDQIPLYDRKNMPNPPQSSKTLRGPGYPVFPTHILITTCASHGRLLMYGHLFAVFPVVNAICKYRKTPKFIGEQMLYIVTIGTIYWIQM